MNLWTLVPYFFLVCLKIQLTLLKLHLPSSVLQNNSFCGECAAGVLLQSGAQHVYLICGPNSTYCPTIMMSHMPGISWTLLTDNATDFNNADRRHFCIVALEGDGISDVVWSNGISTCYRTKMIVSFSSGVTPGDAHLQSMFADAWVNGAIDIVAVVQEARCRVYTYVPFAEGGECNDTRPVLVHSWPKNLTCRPNMTGGLLYFPENKITRLHSCGLIFKHLLDSENIENYLGDLLDFLLRAMGSSEENSVVEISRISNFNLEDCGSGLPFVGTFMAPLTRVQENLLVLPSFLYTLYYGFAVPRFPVRSVHWLRLVNELSYNVWLGLIVSLLFSAACLYVFVKGDKDFLFVALFTLQPLLGVPWSGKFLPSHARKFFVLWLLFCFVIDSCYLCSLLSQLTAPSNDDAIKTVEDLVDSHLPIFTLVSGDVSLDYMYSSIRLGDALKDQTTVLNNDTDFDEKVDGERLDRAFFITKETFYDSFVNKPYKMLPDIAGLQWAPLLMCRHTPYERLFQISVLRALGAGAMALLDSSIRIVVYLAIRHVWKVEGPKPLACSSLHVVFVFWAIGCAVSLFTFTVEYLCHKSPVRRRVQFNVRTIRTT